MKILYHSWVEHNSYILKGLECPFCNDGSEIVDQSVIENLQVGLKG